MKLIFGFTAILILITLIGMGAYLYNLIRKLAKLITKNNSKRLILNVATLGIAALIFVCIFINTSTVIFLLYFFMFSVIIDAIHLIAKKFINTENKFTKIWTYAHSVYILPFILAIAMMIYGHYNIMHIDKTTYTVTTEKNISDKGYRIGMIADLHFGSTIDLDELEKICHEINSHNLDIMVLCGDIVDEHTSGDHIKPVFEILGDIDAKFGTYFVYGNHDCQPYSSSPTFTKDELEKAITDNDIIILEDEVISLDNNFVIAGRNDFSRTNSSSRLPLEDLLKDVNLDDYILILDHQPQEYEENASFGTDLVLSGHTHGGQFWPLNYLLEVIPFNDGTYGLEKIKNTTTIITSGISGWGFPYKTSSDSEYVIIDIKPE